MIKPSERAAVVGVVDPDAYAAGTVSSAWISADQFLRYMAILAIGDLGTGATVDAKIEQASDSSGTGAKDVTGKAITQLTQAGSDDNKQAVIDLAPSDLDHSNGFNHFRLSVTNGTEAMDGAAVVLGVDGVNGPASDYDAATVAEIV